MNRRNFLKTMAQIFALGALTQIIPVVEAQANEPITLANLGEGHASDTWYHAVGRISDVRIYNRALIKAEIQELYANWWSLYKPVGPTFALR